MDDLKCPVVGCKREFSNRFNRDEHAEKCRREWQAGKRAKHGQQSMFDFFSKAPAQPAARKCVQLTQQQQHHQQWMWMVCTQMHHCLQALACMP
jgi:hypothetical protein